MATIVDPLLVNILQKFTVSVGLIILPAGLFGGISNIIVFLSLETFRKSSCAFYLTAMSFANILHLLFSFIPHIITYGFGFDWSSKSISNCTFRGYIVQLWLLGSFTCMCMATIDQFLATCFNPYWHRWSNIKLARYVLTGFFILWIIHGIPPVIFNNLTVSSTNPDRIICSVTNLIYQRYQTFGYIFIFMGTLPLTIMILFGLLAYYNVRNIAYRAVPLVRRELDKQLTQMVLIQVIYNCFVLTPFVIITLIAYNLPTNDQIIFIRIFVITIHNFYFASPFYIYICVSKRFRQQFLHVFYKIYTNQWRQMNINHNHILPQPPTISINKS